jgi:hypothetical protein
VTRYHRRNQGGVPALALEGMLVEIDVIAVVPR